MNINKTKYHSFREFKENFDIIEFEDMIDENFQFKNYSNNKNNGEVIFDTNDILNKFVLKIKYKPKEEQLQTIFTLIDNEKEIMEVAIYIDELYEFKNIFVCDLGEILHVIHHNAENINKLSNIIYPKKFKVIDKEYKKNKNLSLQYSYITIYVLGLITNFLKNRKTIIKNNKFNSCKICSTKIFNNKQNKDTKNIINLNNEKVVYRVSVDNNTVVTTNNKYKKNMLSWNVSGHPRHYKNGKTIWVKPYIKGLGQKKKKTYVI